VRREVLDARRVVVSSCLALGVVCFSHPTLAGKDDAYCPVTFKNTFSRVKPIDFDTGWVALDPDKHPQRPGVGVRFQFYASSAVISTEMSGDAVLSKTSNQSDLELMWKPWSGGGTIDLDMGFEVSGQLAYNFGLLGKGIVELPVPPQLDILRIEQTEMFTPYLLEGDGESKVALSHAYADMLLVTVDIMDLIPMPIPGLSGGVSLYLGGSLEASVDGQRIVTAPSGDLDPIVHEHRTDIGYWPDQGLDSETGVAYYEAEFHLKNQLELTTEIFVQIPFLNQIKFDKIKLPIPLSNQASVEKSQYQSLEFDLSQVITGEGEGEGEGEFWGEGEGGGDIPRRTISQSSDGCSSAAVGRPLEDFNRVAGAGDVDGDVSLLDRLTGFPQEFDGAGVVEPPAVRILGGYGLTVHEDLALVGHALLHSAA
jgi:hypothetical protein